MTTTDLNHAIEILERTPAVVTAMLQGLSTDWIFQNEGGKTWTPFDIVGHLIHGERTDWIPRVKIILADSGNKEFSPFDRYAQFENSKGKTIDQLLDTFQQLRRQNVQELRSFHLVDADFEKPAMHPAFGRVSLSEHIAAWVVHDLTHIAQIARALAWRHHDTVGPFVNYLRILQTPDTLKDYEEMKSAYKK